MRVVENFAKAAGKFDPSLRPAPDMERIKDTILRSEMG